MQRLRSLAVGAYSVSVAPTDDDGAAIALIGDVDLEVTDGAGTVVHSATVTADAGTAKAQIPFADLPHLDTYQLTWSADVEGNPMQWTDELELVGGYHFELAQLRSFDRAFEDTSQYPTEHLRSLRTAAENVIEGEHAANVAFVPRGARAAVDGTGRASIEVPHLEAREVISIMIDGEPWTSEQINTLIVDDCLLRLSPASPISAWPVGSRNIRVHFTHGRNFAPPAIARAALLLVRDHAVPSNIPGRATASSIGEQMFRMTVAGRDGTTGLPEVDAAIQQFARHRVRAGMV